MKFLADMGVSPRVVKELLRKGHDAVHLQEHGLGRMTDPEILQKARESEEDRCVLDKIAMMEACPDGSAALQSYRKLHQAYPERGYYCVHTSRAALDIHERQWLGIRRGHAPVAPLRAE